MEVLERFMCFLGKKKRFEKQISSRKSALGEANRLVQYFTHER